jgi:hypothetical protein
MSHTVFTPRSTKEIALFGDPPVGLHAPTEHNRRCPLAQKVQGRSLEVRSPTAYTFCGAYTARDCLNPVRCAFRFLQPLSALLLRSLPALFHAGNAHGVHTLQSFPLRQAELPSRDPLPSCRCTCQSKRRLQGFHPGTKRLRAVRITGDGTYLLSWVFPLQGFLLSRMPSYEDPLMGLPWINSSPKPQRPSAYYHAGKSV